jgi:hypothetical protein
VTGIELSHGTDASGLVGVKSSKTVYWATTAVIAFIMLFSLYKMFGPLYEHLGFPNYFRIELVVAKLVGLVVLLAPGVPTWLKEWAYAGFAIVLVSASVAHFNSGDPTLNAIEPLGFLVILLVSHRSLHRLRAAS